MAVTQRQWAVLEVLWAQRRATAAEVAAALRDRYGWAYTTVKTMLDRMAKQGLVTLQRDGKACFYVPAVQRASLRRSAWRSFVDLAFGTATAEALHFAAGELSADERAQLRALLDDLDD